MSRQLADISAVQGNLAETPDALLRQWQALQESLQDQPFQSLADCQARLRDIAAWSGHSDQALAMLAQRMAACAERHPGGTRSLWDLLIDALGMPSSPSLESLAAFSQPPYVTFGPNPWLAQLIRHDKIANKGANDRREASRSGSADLPTRTAFAADVTEGKGHAIYNAHSYHTKVPHRAIMRYILHYTQPGDLVFDGFCGTGMTGVAAGMCGDPAELAALGYIVQPDGRLRTRNAQAAAHPLSDTAPLRLGARRAVLMDLSPAATLIAAAYNSPHQDDDFQSSATAILDALHDQFGWMYTTVHHNTPGSQATYDRAIARAVRQLSEAKSPEEAEQVVAELRASGIPMATTRTVAWSDVLQCPHCGEAFVFGEVAVDPESGKVAKQIPCPNCAAQVTKRELQPVFARPDHDNEPALSVPFRVHYEHDGRLYCKKPDGFDIALAAAIERFEISDWYPSERLFHGRETRRNDARGITHVHHFYTPRNLRWLAAMRRQCDGRLDLMLWFTSQLANLSRLNRYRPDVTFPYNPLSGTLYVGSQVAESNPRIAYANKIKKISRALSNIRHQQIVTCGSLSTALLPDAAVDYIFTDPPFGANLAYSELNVLSEAWLGMYTRRAEEAIENRKQGKGPDDYATLMRECFAQYYRVLKPGKWLTVEFHHTQPHVWEALQRALQAAGFVIADVCTLDKQLGTFKQVTNPGAVKQDLIVSAWKPHTIPPSQSLREGTEEEVWEYVESRLAARAVASSSDLKDTEREPFMLFNRTVAEFLRRGATFPLTAAEFYAGLQQRFGIGP